MVLLNLDAGEHADEPEELWALADVLSVACGGHAGDEQSMARVVAFSVGRARPRIGAHPSYPDRLGFGRRSLAVDPQALRQTIAWQCAQLAKVAAAHGQRVQWVKPHGALYHDAAKDLAAAGAVIFGAIEALGPDVIVIGPPGGVLYEASRQAKLSYLREGFADRATNPDGSLVPRDQPGALITDPVVAAARARELVGDVDTICVHADTPGALAIARAVREALDA
ncbi:MAG TPA: LamB/YcsF family protein [Kofleriaceae bacterium]|nr:LamB/YcsF family protein [Kofleriaceae bacterium]